LGDTLLSFVIIIKCEKLHFSSPLPLEACVTKNNGNYVPKIRKFHPLLYQTFLESNVGDIAIKIYKQKYGVTIAASKQIQIIENMQLQNCKFCPLC
jgi:hypothetical protein